MLDGGIGFDRAIYSDATGGVTINLAAGTASGAGCRQRHADQVEGAVGSDFADTFNAAGFTGLTGQPTVQPSARTLSKGGAATTSSSDDINPLGQAVTRVEYLSATAAVTVDIAAGTVKARQPATSPMLATTLSRMSPGSAGRPQRHALRQQQSPASPMRPLKVAAAMTSSTAAVVMTIVTYNGDTTTTSGITVHLAAGTVTGDATVGTDIIRDVEAARGTNFDDVFDASGYGVAGAVNVSSTNGTLQRIWRHGWQRYHHR